MGGLTPDGTAEAVSRDQFLRRERVRKKIANLSIHLTIMKIIGNHTGWCPICYRICDDHSYIHRTWLSTERRRINT